MLPFLAAVSDSISSVSESSIASRGGDCGRFDGALVAVDAIRAVFDGAWAAVDAFPVTVDVIGTVSDGIALGAVGAFSVAIDAVGAVLGGIVLGIVGASSVVIDATGASLEGLALGVNAFLVAVDALVALLDG